MAGKVRPAGLVKTLISAGLSRESPFNSWKMSSSAHVAWPTPQTTLGCLVLAEVACRARISVRDDIHGPHISIPLPFLMDY